VYGLLLRRRLAAAGGPGTSWPGRISLQRRDLLLLPDVLLVAWVGALAGLTGHARVLVPVALASAGLALWAFAPGYVTSKVLPLALIAVGLDGITQDHVFISVWNSGAPHLSSWPGQYGLIFPYPAGGGSPLHASPIATLVQAWVFIAAGLLLTWVRTEPHSRLLRAPGPAGGRRPGPGRPRWGLVLLLVAVLVSERVRSVFGWIPPANPLWWLVPMAAIAGIAAWLVFRFPTAAADLAVVGLIGFGLDGIEIERTYPQGLAPQGFGTAAYGFSLVTDVRSALLACVQGVVLVAAGLWLLPRALDERTRSLFRSAPDRELAGRVLGLARSRADAVDSAAAELRRLERDLHDGAQARLVALGISLRAAERLIHVSPDRAAALVAEARECSLIALGELRDLVRGIRPPVLADRGLADAVRALALDTPLHTDVEVDLPARPDLAVESACYFAIAELLANAVRHSGARHAQVRISHDNSGLKISVTDDGGGGADPARGTGLAGLERRLAAFDGVLAVSSPPGGPTIIAIEVPCTLSSPKPSTTC
jgi:signal transduction histidine kinase